MPAKTTFALLLFVLFAGCREREAIVSKPSRNTGVQLFDETVLKSSPGESVTILHPANKDAWSPMQVILDYKDNACYGAMIRYRMDGGTFEELCDGINERLAVYEVDAFADDPEMRMWRNEESRFAVQLTEDEEAFTVAYVCFIDLETTVESVRDLMKKEPELTEGMDRIPFGEWEESDEQLEPTGANDVTEANN